METHTHAKRGGGGLDLKYILAIAIGSVVAINVLVLGFWLILRRQNKKLDQEYRRHSRERVSMDLESVIREKSDHRSSTYSHPDMPRLQYIQARPFLQPPKSAKPTSYRTGGPRTLPAHHPLFATNPSPRSAKPTYPPTPSYSPKAQSERPRKERRLRRANSFDTASIYSSASAPREHHEKILRTQPFALDPKAPSHAWAPRLFQPPPVMVRKDTKTQVYQFRSGQVSASPLSLQIRSLDDLPFDTMSILSVTIPKDEFPSAHPYQPPVKTPTSVVGDAKDIRPLRIRRRTMSAPYPERPPSMLSPTLLAVSLNAAPPAMPARSPLRNIERSG